MDSQSTVRRLRGLAALFGAMLSVATGVAHAVDAAASIQKRACGALAERVGHGPEAALLLRSFDAPDGTAPVEPALRTAAFSYDNALAVVALLACDRRAEALRVGEALRRAAIGKTRLRNAYRAGVVTDSPLPNGWWSSPESRWVEDPYQIGTATGNVAWTALALLALNDATGDGRWREAAEALGRWVRANAGDGRTDGFTGGVQGFDADPQKLGWKSTEHNIDLAAMFAWLDRLASGRWSADESRARRFVQAQWDAGSGHFLVGTLADGKTPNRATSALDAQLWAQLLPGVPAEWRKAVGYVEKTHAVPGGFDFNADRDGLWLEGTAQAALVYRLLGRHREAGTLLTTIANQFATGGFVFATREARISTGLALGPASTSADFYYYRLPHLGATAWAVLAATGRNPFVAGRQHVDPGKPEDAAANMR